MGKSNSVNKGTKAPHDDVRISKYGSANGKYWRGNCNLVERLACCRHPLLLPEVQGLISTGCNSIG